MKAVAAPIAAEAIPNNAYGSISTKSPPTSNDSEFKLMEAINEALIITHMMTKPIPQERAEHIAESIGFVTLLPFTNPIGMAVNIETNIAELDNNAAKIKRPKVPSSSIP
jgi:hypothetical protein